VWHNFSVVVAQVVQVEAHVAN
jgi:hypothetical protein